MITSSVFFIEPPSWFLTFYDSLSKREIFSQKNNAIIQSTGKSREYICRLFKKTTGYTLAAYLNIQRIEHAADLLISSDLSIIDIALESGFENLSTFYHRFKTEKGVSPKLYRSAFKQK